MSSFTQTVSRILFLLSLMAAVDVTLAQSPGGVAWQSDLDAARTLAQQQNKLLLVHFWSEHCAPCRALDAAVFTQPSVAATLQTHYVPVKLNANEFPATAQRFGITRVPTDVIVTPQGEVLERLVSPGTPMAYISQVSGIAQKYQQDKGRQFSRVAGNHGTTEPVNTAYADLSVPAEQATREPIANAQPPAVANNPFAQQQSPLANSENVRDRYATQADRYAEQPAPAAAIEPQATVNPYAPYAATTPADPPAAPDAARQLELPPNSPPLGFFGYCPVTMKEENRWQRGDTQWGAYHRGRTYLFASEQHRDKFVANGDAYAPALSGIDPVLALDQNVAIPGEQQFAVEYDGQFYLFSSEDTLKQFWDNATRYASGARQAINVPAAGRTLR